MLLFVLVVVAGYFAYHYWGWPGAAGAAAVYCFYLLISFFMRASREQSQRVNGALLVGTPLSESEKAHIGMMKERDQRMAERQAAKKKYR